MKQLLSGMTINIAGLSAHSCIAMEFKINDNNIKFHTVSESHRRFQSFGKYDIYRAHSNKLGCSLLIHKQLNSYEVQITPREGVDCCSAAISNEKRTFLSDRYTYIWETLKTSKAPQMFWLKRIRYAKMKIKPDLRGLEFEASAMGR